MDGQRFDQITRSFASGVSRRNALKGLFGLAGGSALASMAGGSSLAEPGKTAICHFPPDDPDNVKVIEVANPALPDHFAHGDFAFTDCCTDADCGEGFACLDSECGAVGCSSDDDCEEGRVCLSNGTCAIPCERSQECEGHGCPANCSTSVDDTSLILVCATGGSEVRCSTTADCPLGNACFGNCGPVC